MTTKEPVFSKDTANKKLTVVKTFDAPLAQVWKNWTESALLDQWWAPKPWRAETKKMDYREGGFWLYAMIGPNGDTHWCKESFKTIEAQKRITSAAVFCDEAGNANKDFPTMYWKKEFSETGNTTIVTVEMSFDSEADMETILKMGFREGFTMGLGNLDQLLSTQATEKASW